MACSKQATTLDKILKCAVCEDTVKNPQTLTCFHSVCQDCIAQLVIVKEGEEQGFQCPICRVYTSKAKVDSSFLLNEFLKKQGKGQSYKAKCETCLEKAASWMCKECKLALCDICKTIHLRTPLLRNHTIVDKGSDDNTLIDPLIFCLVHNDQPIVFNCKQCETPLCLKCKVTDHENHATETTENCLDRILPKVKECTSKIDDVIKTMDEKVNTLRNKKDELKSAFEKCKEQAKTNLNAIIEKARKEHSQLIKQIEVKEEEELTKLEIVAAEMTGKELECQQVMDWANTSLELATGVALMSEIQVGLFSKVKQLSEFKSEQKLTLDFPSLEAIPCQEINLIGSPKYKSEVILKPQSKVRFSFPDNFNNIQNVQTIKLSGRCTRIGLINGKLWCPVPDKNVIEVIDMRGNKKNDISMPNNITPCAVQQALNGDIFLASDSGLYLLHSDGSVLSKLIHGKYSDVSTDGDIMVALKYDSSEVHIFMYQNKGWEKHIVFKANSQNTHNEYTILYNNVSRCVYVSGSNNIFQYSLEGVETNRYTGFIRPYLCEMDAENRLIVVDRDNKQIKITGSERKSIPLEFPPFSCVVTNAEIWILRLLPCGVTQLKFN